MNPDAHAGISPTHPRNDIGWRHSERVKLLLAALNGLYQAGTGGTGSKLLSIHRRPIVGATKGVNDHRKSISAAHSSNLVGVMDPLSDILSGVRILDALFTRLEFRAPWGITAPGGPGVKFVLVVRGSATLAYDSQPAPIELHSGDVCIMIDDAPHRLYEHAASPSITCAELEKLRIGNLIEYGGSGAVTSIISGIFTLESLQGGPLLNVLPKILHLKFDQHRSLAFQSVLELLAVETGGPGLGYDAVVSRLFELLFVHAIRAYSLQPDGPKEGWLAAIADRNLAQVLAAMHAEPSRDWTVETLASAAGMSRSAFAARFRAVVGQPPLDYLTQWRVYCAIRLMHKQNLSLDEVSQRIGYDSTSAFNRMFKRKTGLTPGMFRKTMAQPQPPQVVKS